MIQSIISIAEFNIDIFKEDEKIELKEFVDKMFETMKKYIQIYQPNQVKNHIECLLWEITLIFLKVRNGYV